MIDLDPHAITPIGGDGSAVGLWPYVWRMTGWRQLVLCFGAIAVSLLALVPIELQRRVIDDAIMKKDLALLVSLGVLYVGVLVAIRTANFALALAQAWLAESAVRHTRSELLALYRDQGDGEARKPGEAVAIAGSEVDKIGGYVGIAPSQACADAAIVLGVVGYMFVVAPSVAGVSIALLVPQLLLAPMLQNRLNQLIEARLGMLRAFGDAVVGDSRDQDGVLIDSLYTNHMRFYLWKHLMKALLNLANGLAPVAVLLFGGWMVVEGQTTLGVLVAFLSGFQRLATPINSLITFYRETAQARVQYAMIARWM